MHSFSTKIINDIGFINVQLDKAFDFAIEKSIAKIPIF